MCGIAAIFAYGTAAAPVSADELVRIDAAMASRGPDGSGTWIAADGRVGLAHRRLAILDPSPAGAQPMHHADSGCVLSFNGEIYNFRELRAALEQAGETFRSDSDTEVVLALYAREGPAFVERLRGMYALALWDPRERGLLLARDPLGIKPLYWSDEGGTLRAASQVKALLAGGGIEAARDPAGRVGFHLWGYVPEPFTLYRRIRSLPAGTRMWIDAAGPQAPRRHFDLTDTLAAAEAAPAGDAADLGPALAESVQAHLVSDVPVGLFLSAGLDSASLAAFAAPNKPDLRCFTLGAQGHAGETAGAAEIAQTLGLSHLTAELGAADFAGAQAVLLAAMDQPSVDGANVWLVAREAAARGLKVALSGLGGDELFGSYPSFRQVPATARRLAPLARVPGLGPALGRGFRLISAPLARHLTSPKYAGLLEYGGSLGGAYLLRRGLFMPWELPALMEPEEVRTGWAALASQSALADTVRGLRTPHLQVAALEMAWYMRGQLLRDADWAGMAHGLEIRTPLVDAWLLRRLAPLLAGPARPPKSAMPAAAERATGVRLPDWVAARPKSGFALPVRDWLMQADPAAAGGPAWLTRGLRGWARTVDAAFSEPGA
jgi:asparagine synthase (glutamine-hydrolysing)